jgi:ATP-dependent Lhr-like helicase
VPALTANRILFRDGAPIATLEGGETRLLHEMAPSEAWVIKKALVGRQAPPALPWPAPEPGAPAVPLSS